MAGWTCPDKDLIEWEGTIKAKNGFLGDGSRLTNIPAVTETDPIWTSVSGAVHGDIVALSGAYYAHIPQYNRTSGALVVVSGALYALSGAFNTTFMPMYQQTSGALASLSAAYVAHLIQNNVTSAGLVVVSSAYYAHAADASNPHTVNLTQTYLALTSGAVSADITNSGAMYIPNLVFNTTSAGVTASNYPIGSLLVVYTE